MKIAVCISGQFRFYDQTVRSIIEHLIEPYNCDVFCCFSNDISNSYDKISDDQILTKINNAFASRVKETKIITSELSVKTGSSFASDQLVAIREYGNVHPRSKKLELCDELRRKHQKENNFEYDVVVSIRSDFLFNKRFVIEENIKDNTVYVIGKSFTNKEKGYENIPRVWDGLWYANGDTFENAAHDIINWFPSMSGIREDPDELFEKLRLGCFIFSPENSLLYNWMIRKELNIELLDMEIKYIRPDGVIKGYTTFKPIEDKIAKSLPQGFNLPVEYCNEDLTHLC